MNTELIGIALTFAMMGGVLALADGSKLQSANSANVFAMKDRCPYYPSPVVCRGGSRARTTSDRLTPIQAAVDVEEGHLQASVWPPPL
jgi:hypothetical protein